MRSEMTYVHFVWGRRPLHQVATPIWQHPCTCPKYIYIKVQYSAVRHAYSQMPTVPHHQKGHNFPRYYAFMVFVPHFQDFIF